MENDGPRRRIGGSGRRHSATRELVLRLVEAQSAPVSTAALTAATGLHENTVRGHLDQLHADGYLRREREHTTGRGRPAWLWRAVRSEPESSYARLAAALAETLARTSDNPGRQAREAGRAWGAEIAAGSEDDGTPRDAVIAAMRDQGFAPAVAASGDGDGDGTVVVLHRCPLIEAATKYPEIVCAVHQGIVDGLLEARGERGGSTLLPFTAPGECTLRLGAAR